MGEFVISENSRKDILAGRVATADFYRSMTGGVYASICEMPDQLKILAESGFSDESCRDYMGVLEKGKNWLIEPLRDVQPHSYSAFNDVVGDLKVGVVWIEGFVPDSAPGAVPVMFMDAGGYVIEINPTCKGESYEEGDTSFGSLLALPESLATSWLWRTDGWRAPSEPFQGPLRNRMLIGHPLSAWIPFDNYLDSLGEGFQDEYLERFVRFLPDMAVVKGTRRSYKLRCFLDTRPANSCGPFGDQFFVCSTRLDQVVYHLRGGDLERPCILVNPAEAIDLYCAHVLRAQSGEFDFSPWSRPVDELAAF